MGKTPDIFDGDYAGIKLGLCQVATEEWDLEGNCDRLLAAVDEAADRGAQLAVTPECAIHGYAQAGTDELKKKLLHMAEPVDGPRLTRLAEKARERGIALVAGFAERAGDRVHNSAALFSPAGEHLFTYRKVHCRPFESVEQTGMFTPGEEFLVTDLELGGVKVRAGALICFDREMPESTRCLRALGAELLLCPLATNTSRLDQPEDRADNEMITRVRAAENELFIAVINHAGRYNGGSFVVGPGGETLVQLGSKPETAVVDVPVGVLAERFHSRPLGWMGWAHRRPAVYQKHLP